MPERKLKAKVEVDSADLKKLPAEAAAAAAGVSARLAEIAKFKPDLSLPTGKGVRKTAEDLIREQGIGLAGMRKQWADVAKLRDKLQGDDSQKRLTLADRINQRLRAQAVAAVAKEEQDKSRVRSKFGVHPGERPTAVGGTSGSIGAGLFRGFAQELGSLTGIGIPFLSLSPVFIAASAAASALSIGVIKALGAINDLAQGISKLRQQAGGGVEQVSRLAATGRQFGVDTADLTTGIEAMRKGIEAGNPAVRRLGVTFEDASGQARPYAAIFGDVRDAISQIKDPTLQASVANDIFGSSYQKLMPYLIQTSQVIAANAAAIDSQTKSGAAAVAQQDIMNKRVKAGENAWNQFWEGVGKNTVGALGDWADLFGKIGDMRDEAATRDKAIQEARIKGLSDAEVKAAGDTAVEKLRISKQQATAITPIDVSVAPERAIERLGTLASAALEARIQSDQLNQSLLQIGQQRLQITFQIGMAERQIANTLFEQQQALANQAEDRAMQLAEQVAALTITLNEFRAAEQSAAIRAREEEKSFFAFRPDNALRRANEEYRYQRDRAQEIARNERLNSIAADQLANQKEIAAFESANLDRQEKNIAMQTALFAFTHDDVITESKTAIARLAAAIAERDSRGTALTLKVLLDSPNFTEEEKARIIAIVGQVIGQAATDALGIIRSNSKSGNMLVPFSGGLQ